MSKEQEGQRDLKATQSKIINELYAIPMVSISIRMIKQLGLMFRGNRWLRISGLSVTTMFNVMQVIYMILAIINDPFEVVIRDGYMCVLWLNALIRGYLVYFQRENYKFFLADFIELYKEIQNSTDVNLIGLLNNADVTGKRSFIINLCLGLMTTLAFCLHPLLYDEKMLPFGTHLPGFSVSPSPVHEICYAYQVLLSPYPCMMYISCGSLLVSLIMFAIVMCKVLQYRLLDLTKTETIHAKIKWCIKYQKKLIRYVQRINDLATYVFLIEFASCGVLLCGLLFLINIAQTPAQVITAVAQIAMIFSQILTLCWYANELSHQSTMVAEAAYNIAWYTYEKQIQRNILMLMMRAQKPCNIMVGNIYPMTLELFQALLNVSYSYFTILRRIYG